MKVLSTGFNRSNGPSRTERNIDFKPPEKDTADGFLIAIVKLKFEPSSQRNSIEILLILSSICSERATRTRRIEGGKCSAPKIRVAVPSGWSR